jgi:hypothetical protein
MYNISFSFHSNYNHRLGASRLEVLPQKYVSTLQSDTNSTGSTESTSCLYQALAERAAMDSLAPRDGRRKLREWSIRITSSPVNSMPITVVFNSLAVSIGCDPRVAAVKRKKNIKSTRIRSSCCEDPVCLCIACYCP